MTNTIFFISLWKYSMKWISSVSAQKYAPNDCRKFVVTTIAFWETLRISWLWRFRIRAYVTNQYNPLSSRVLRHPIISSHYISSRSFRPIHFVPRSLSRSLRPLSFCPVINSSHTFCPLPFCPKLILSHTLCPCTICPIGQVICDDFTSGATGTYFLGFIFPLELFICWEFIKCIKILAHPHSSPWPPLSPSPSLELSPSLWSLCEIYPKMYGTKWKGTKWFWGKMKGDELNGTKWVWDEMNGT
jgi:hypothetical protein